MSVSPIVILPVPGPTDPWKNPGIVPPWLQYPDKGGARRVDGGDQLAVGIGDRFRGSIRVVVPDDGLDVRRGVFVGQIDARRAERATVGSFNGQSENHGGINHDY